MRKSIHVVLLLVIAILVSGCADKNFLVYKGGYHFFVTSDGTELRTILCDSGDLRQILSEVELSAQTKKGLNDSICGSGKVRERVLAVLEGMTKEERMALKLAFGHHGYDINNVANC